MNMISILKQWTKRRVDLYNGPVEYRDLALNQLERN